MKPHLVIVAPLVLLTLAVILGADETVIPPEVNWTGDPPPREAIEAIDAAKVHLLLQYLLKKGMITRQERSGLPQSQSDMPAGESHEMTPEPEASDRTSP